MASDSSHWSVATCDHEGRPLLVRYRGFASDFPREIYPERLNVIWTMSEQDENGLATDDESDRLTTFENRLVAALERTSAGVLSVVLTTGGQREFVFHTADRGDFLQRLTDMPQETERYPIEIHGNRDPEWVYDDEVRPTTDTSP